MVGIKYTVEPAKRRPQVGASRMANMRLLCKLDMCRSQVIQSERKPKTAYSLTPIRWIKCFGRSGLEPPLPHRWNTKTWRLWCSNKISWGRSDFWLRLFPQGTKQADGPSINLNKVPLRFAPSTSESLHAANDVRNLCPQMTIPATVAFPAKRGKRKV